VLACMLHSLPVGRCDSAGKMKIENVTRYFAAGLMEIEHFRYAPRVVGLMEIEHLPQFSDT